MAARLEPRDDILDQPASVDGRPVDYDPERGQAIVRLVIANIFVAYTAYLLLSDQVPSPSKWVLIGYSIFLETTSIGFLALVIWSPGVNHVRRVTSMFHDYGSIVFALIHGDEAMLPITGVLLWVTVGNGFRFGTRYLLASTILALIGLGVTSYYTPYWRAQPYIPVTLVVMTIIVPAYAYMLLARVQKAHAAALEANLAKSRFLAQASHDLRQPIHAISLFTACLRDAGLGPEEKRMVDNIDKSLQGVSRLFRSLLDVSTLDSGKVKPRMETVALGSILEDVARQNSQAAQWAGVELRVVPTRAHVHADGSLIATMVQNVVSNALKYAPGRPVLIGCRRRGGTLSIEVLDRGEGIPASAQPQVFEEFFQLRKLGEKDIEGVGLGLSIVKRLAGLMGMSASIRSRERKGTAIVIEGLKIVDAAVAPPKPRAAPVASMNGLRVLLVEDDESVLLATATLLEKWGCAVQAEIRVPTTGSTCDLVITDFDLGKGSTGADCIAAVRRLNGRKVPAVVMTGHDAKRVRQELGDADVPILSKPVRPAELRSIVMAQKLKADRESRVKRPVEAVSL